ncbi:hypothetical protein EYF80_024426 [Liparis tanakae]|uniref:Uncharacterized protein n=1 Tax=Liparis tanakae TaxID=230148 RepID=A0A4Z2HIM4_9TELE|nr:hypothetical protein EYF80_024426 [Liparis tanakae]
MSMYHHWISRDMGAELTALKAQGISTSSPSPTFTSLGTSRNPSVEAAAPLFPNFPVSGKKLLFVIITPLPRNTPWKRSLLYQLMCVQQETHSDSFNETLLEERGINVFSYPFSYQFIHQYPKLTKAGQSPQSAFESHSPWLPDISYQYELTKNKRLTQTTLDHDKEDSVLL